MIGGAQSMVLNASARATDEAGRENTDIWPNFANSAVIRAFAKDMPTAGSLF